ncbi:hypothetical protein D3C71_1459770 [compost metagenome]
MAMDDIGFDSFQQAILSTKTTVSSVDDVLAVLEEDTYDDIEDGQEYAKAKELAKKASTPKRTVDGIEMGDTSFFENGGLASNFRPKVGGFGESTSSSSEQTETRNVSASQKQHKAIERKSSELDLSGFQGIQGIKQPINITANNIPTTGGKFQELFNTMNWTLLSK